MDKQRQTQFSLVWAKSDYNDPQKIHLLLFHLLESAAVTLILWQESLSKSIKEDIANQLNLSITDTGKMLAYWVGLHDIGKASPVFQSALEQKNSDLIMNIRNAGLPIRKDTGSAYHSHISGKFIRENAIAPKEIDIAISGHHGLWNSYYVGISIYSYGNQAWDVLRKTYCEVLKNVLSVHSMLTLEMEAEKKNSFVTWFSGLICVADWVASDETKFQYQSKWVEPSEYFENACLLARQVLQNIGWIGWRSDGKLLTFHEMYPQYSSPNDVQQQAIDAFHNYHMDSPFLMVVEAPTGCGKTEIAMYLADQWLQQSNGSGLYIAMPTQATSNQIYHRSLDVLARRYPDQKVNVVLAHGQAYWNEELQKIRVAQVGDSQQDQSLVAAEWFQNNRKRTLLAPFGVGTVDQIFLSILQTKHFFVRLFGLKNKVIVFDEVHAYDIYMNTLFYRLLEWLRGLGASVIILSATLPEKTRKGIVTHYCGVNTEGVNADSHYPRVTLASQRKDPKAIPLQLDSSARPLSIRWVSEEEIPALLAERLSNGGCVAVICNTVRKAQETYLQLRDKQLVDKKNLTLFHARYPVCWRNPIEKEVLENFGKESTLEKRSRPQKAIVVATQVIEQSLDLDFDLIVSELAPIDLILQRAGRLHRHSRKDRPQKLSSPELYILDIPEDNEGVPQVGAKEPFYLKNVLLKTYHVLHRNPQIEVIASTHELIEKVYDDRDEWDEFPPMWNTKLKKWQEEEMDKREIKIDDASFTLIDSPSSKRLLYRGTKQLEELDDENIVIMEQMQAKTRDGRMSIKIPCLFTNDGATLFSDLECQHKFGQELGEEDILKTLSGNEIGVSNPLLLRAINQGAKNFDQYFPKVKKLKNRKFLRFQMNQEKGKLDIGDFHLEISHELGLTYQYGGNDAGV